MKKNVQSKHDLFGGFQKKDKIMFLTVFSCTSSIFFVQTEQVYPGVQQWIREM